MAEPFYAEGLRFACARCSGCCRGGPGYVFLARSDLARLLARLDLDFRDFFAAYCTLVDSGTGLTLSLREVKRGSSGSGLSHDCVFWGEGGCRIYEDRPIQCSTYPFWASVLGSQASWRDEASSCPGIGRGELRSRGYIQERLLARRKAGTIVLDYGFDPERADADTILGGEGLGPDSADAFQG